MKNKKGFTLVELVIVIAVIAILSAVLVPTFSNVIESAKVSSATQRAQNAFKEYYSQVSVASTNDEVDSVADLSGYVIVVDNGTGFSDYYFVVNSQGQLTNAKKINYTKTGKSFKENGATTNLTTLSYTDGTEKTITVADMVLEEQYAVEGVDIYYTPTLKQIERT